MRNSTIWFQLHLCALYTTMCYTMLYTTMLYTRDKTLQHLSSKSDDPWQFLQRRGMT